MSSANRMTEYKLPQEVVERGIAANDDWHAERGSNAWTSLSPEAVAAVLSAALNLSDDPVERVARALYENEEPGSFVDVSPNADYPDGQKWVKWPAWDSLGSHDPDQFPEYAAALDHYRDSAEVALQALGPLEPEGEERT